MEPPERPAVAGVDIDGVLSDPGHRLHFVQRRPKNWRAFFRQAHLDPALPEGIDTVRRLIGEGLTPLFVTGRPEYLRKATERWLADNSLPAGPLYLRPRRDFRPAAELKLEVYQRITREFDVRVIVDDDAAVVAQLREAGFSVILADWLDNRTTIGLMAEVQEEQGRT